MNKEKSPKKSFKFIGWIIPIVILILFKAYVNKQKNDTDEYFANGGSDIIAMSTEYDSLQIGNLKIKFPTDYNITDKFGSANFGGYTLMKYSQDELTINYYSNAERGTVSRSLDESIKSLEEEILKTVKSQITETPTLLPIEITKLGEFDTHIREIIYGDNHFYIYAIASSKHLLTFTSHKKYLLNAIINRIQISNNEDYDEKVILVVDSSATKTFNRLKIPLYNWEVVKELDIKEIDTYHIILKNGDDLIALMSTTNQSITDIKDFSNYYNEKTVRNMKPGGLILTSKGVKRDKFHGTNSVTELFSVYHQKTGKKYELEAITIKLSDYFYNIVYPTSEGSKMIIDNIEILNQ